MAATRGCKWRRIGWISAALLMLLPAVAMLFTDEVNWDDADFLIFSTMLVAAVGTFDITTRMTGNAAYRAAVGVAVVSAFMLVWINLAVGIIGSEDNPANLMYGGVIAVALIGAVAARCQPAGMARALAVTAVAQMLVGVIALLAGWGSTARSFPTAIVFLTGFLTLLWLLSAWLFNHAAAQMRPPSGAAP